MSTTPVSPKKVCVVCREDCSSRPRTKDRQGRYYCRDCYETALRTKGAQAAAPKARPRDPSVQPKPPQDDGDFDPFADLSALAPSEPLVAAHRLACPKCAAETPVGAVICTKCGFDRRTGQTVTAPVPMAAPGKAGKPRGRGVSFGGAPEWLSAPWVWFVAPLAVLLPLLLLARTSDGFTLLFFGVFMLSSLTVTICVLYHAFSDSVVTGVLCLLFGPYQLYYVVAKMEAPRTKAAWGAMVVATVLLFVLSFGGAFAAGGAAAGY